MQALVCRVHALEHTVDQDGASLMAKRSSFGVSWDFVGSYVIILRYTC